MEIIADKIGLLVYNHIKNPERQCNIKKSPFTGLWNMYEGQQSQCLHPQP